MTHIADCTFIDKLGKVHIFEHRVDKLPGDVYVWKDITGHQHAFMRGMTMDFELWVAEVIRGILIAEIVA